MDQRVAHKQKGDSTMLLPIASKLGERTVCQFVTAAMLLMVLLASKSDAQERGNDGITRHPPGWLPAHALDEQGKPRAHIHNPDMSCCVCTPTAADRDSDVFKRPCFLQALGRSRETVRSFVNGLTGGLRDGNVKLDTNQIPDEDLQAFQMHLERVLNFEYLPGEWNQVQFEGLAFQPMKPRKEVRNGIPTVLGYEPDLSQEVKLRDGNGIQAAWAVNGIEVLPYTTYYEDNTAKGILVRLRLGGKRRLILKARRPADFLESGGLRDNFSHFFETGSFHALLTNVFRVPFLSPDDMAVVGFDAQHEGVRVFHGKILSRDWYRHRIGPNAKAGPAHWWDEMRLLVTDSDPQYFCVQIALREKDNPP